MNKNLNLILMMQPSYKKPKAVQLNTKLEGCLFMVCCDSITYFVTLH